MVVKKRVCLKRGQAHTDSIMSQGKPSLMEIVLLLEALRADEDNIGAEGAVASVSGIRKLCELVSLGLLGILEGNELHQTCRSKYADLRCGLRTLR
jgi:hypothetical protein